MDFKPEHESGTDMMSPTAGDSIAQTPTADQTNNHTMILESQFDPITSTADN